MPSTTQRPLTAFVSGHTDLSEANFESIYLPLLNAAIAQGHNFLIGDALGVDSFALQYLLSDVVKKQFPDVATRRITVYPGRSHTIPALQAQGINVVSLNDARLQLTSEIAEVIGVVDGGKDHARYKFLIKDARMTLDSDYDILYVRGEEESRAMYGKLYRARVSATELNRRRREFLVMKREAKEVHRG
ncbi:hypothetical protein LTR33_009041 [Friedmanniomyces endolithicus]|nr:hypothetical protein LTR33_009041 [Friedmanniomyces endolithicus]